MKRMRTSHRFRLYKEARRALSTAYPSAFPQKGRRPPLKVGILRDILDDGSHGLPACRVRLFLSIWTRSTSYLESVARKKERVALDGGTTGTVSAAHASEAENAVAARRTRSKAFDSAERIL